jgi:PAS domain S-box-containing protein
MNGQESPIFQLEDFIEITTDALIVIDQERRILLFNPSAEKIFGYSSAEILGLSTDQMMGCTSIDPLWRAILKMARHSRGMNTPLCSRCAVENLTRM